MACRVHNVRFYSPKPTAIHCMALQSDLKLLAVSRDNASIEIWDLKGRPILSRKILGGTPSGSIEAMCWVRDRLLSTGLSGAVVEWDLKKLTIKSSILVTGHAAWCIDVTKSYSKIAVGTEQGFVNIFSVEDNSLQYEKLFDKQDGRILCCKFDKTENILVTGSIQTIRIWNVATGQALHKMSTARAEKKKETIIWCLEITDDLTIISGDSRGRLTFWDGKLGEQIESLQTHKADILSICLSEDQNSLYCSGVDPVIVSYTKVKMKHKGSEQEYVEKWVKSIQRNIHQHDVRSMVMFGKELITGGVDGYLSVSVYPPKFLVRHPPISSENAVLFCKNSKLVCLRYESSIEIWQLGTANPNQNSDFSIQEDNSQYSENLLNETNGEVETNNTENGDIKLGRRLGLFDGPKLVVRLTTPSNLPLVCYAISPNGKWIAFSTEKHFRIFKFTMENDSPTLSKLVPLPTDCIQCYKMEFSSDSNTLVIASADAMVQFLHIHDDGAVTIQNNLTSNTVLTESTLTHLHISEKITKNSFYMALADAGSNIGIWEITKKRDETIPKLIARLPQYKCPPGALTFDNQSQNLLVVYTDQKLVEYDLEKLKFTKWSEDVNNIWGSNVRQSHSLPPRGISVHPTLPHIIMTFDDSAVYFINKKDNVDIQHEPKKQKGNNNNLRNEKSVNCRVKRYKHLVSAGWVMDKNNEAECAVVVVDPTNLIEKLPPMFYKPRFGCM